MGNPQYWMTLAWGVAVLCAYYGYGRALVRVLQPGLAQRAGWGLICTWGLCVLLALCGVLLSLGWFSRASAVTVVALGIALLGIAISGFTPIGAESLDVVSGASPMTTHPMTAHGSDNAYGERLKQFTDELGLTGQQLTDIQIITTNYATRLGDMARLGRVTAESLLGTDPADPDYRQHTDEAAALAASSAAETVVLLAEMRAMLYKVLTAEQRDLLRQKLEEAKQAHEAKHRAKSEATPETE